MDLSGFGSKIRWLVKQSGFHDAAGAQARRGGTYLVGDHADGWVDAFDWYVSEVLIASVRWRRLDPQNVVTIVGGRANAAGWVEARSESASTRSACRLDAGQQPRQRRILRRGLDRGAWKTSGAMRVEILRG